MAPCATSAEPGLLEHPAEAFAAYAADGIAEVMCEEKHMGSRAIVLACRDDEPAGRFAEAGGLPGAVYTRTGRPFFAAARTAELLDVVRAAVTTAGLWDELDTSWLLLDCELMPWSVKAEQLLRQQYAAARLASPTREGPHRLVQPGIKVRGPDYLRIIYGPDYALPENLARLRDRNLGRKRSLALREYALGIEALDRVVSGEPMWRVHEAVFGVLALESEPVDPRL